MKVELLLDQSRIWACTSSFKNLGENQSTGLLQGALGPWIREWGSEMILFAFQSAYENSVEMLRLKNMWVEFATWKSNNVSTLQDAVKAKEDWEAKQNQ